MYRGCTDVWQVYRCIEHTDMWGMHLWHTDKWGMYRGCKDVQGIYRCMGVYRCMGHTDMERCTGELQMYGAIQTYVGMYGGIQTYGGKQMCGP